MFSDLGMLKFHNNNLTEIELLLNIAIQEKGKVEISFFTSGVIVKFSEVRKVRIRYLGGNVRVELMKISDSTIYNKFEYFNILDNDFMYSILTGSGGKSGEEIDHCIFFHEVSDKLKKIYKKSR